MLIDKSFMTLLFSVNFFFSSEKEMPLQVSKEICEVRLKQNLSKMLFQNTVAKHCDFRKSHRIQSNYFKTCQHSQRFYFVHLN